MILIDISHWQGDIDWDKVKKDEKDIEGAIIKCSESLNFIDPKFKRNKEEARRVGMIVGYYHFARNNNPKDEADYFLKSVGDIQPGELLALDAETGQSEEWRIMFLNRILEKAKFKPLVYPKGGEKCLAGNYGLWTARYGLNTGEIPTLFKPKIVPYPFFAMWQYTSRGKVDGIKGNVDLNICYMDRETLKKYGKPAECSHCQIHCPK